MIKKLVSHLGEYKRAAVLTPLFAALEAVMDVLLPTIMAFIIDQGIEKGDMNAILKYGLLTFLVAVVALALGVLAGKYAAEASTGFAGNLRDAMYENIQHYSFSNIDKFSTAGLVTRMTTDVTNVQNAFQMIERMCVRAPVHLVFALFMAVMIGGPLSLIFVVAVVFLVAVLAGIMVPTFHIFDRVFKNYDALNASVQENVSAIRVVKSFVREGFENEKYTKACQSLYDQFVNAESRLSFNNPAMLTAVYGCNIALSWLGAKYVLHGAITTGQLNALFGYIMNILMALMMLSMAFVMISMSAASAKRIVEVLDETTDLPPAKQPVQQVKDGGIEFEHVTFKYKHGSGQPVLNDITFSIKPGETLGIIGGTGSAKSSLVQLIPRLYDAESGTVKVGGVDVRDYNLDVLRREVSMVLQKNVLFSGTILDNLRWGDENASEEECIRVAKLACADEFIERFPDKSNHGSSRAAQRVRGQSSADHRPRPAAQAQGSDFGRLHQRRRIPLPMPRSARHSGRRSPAPPRSSLHSAFPRCRTPTASLCWITVRSMVWAPTKSCSRPTPSIRKFTTARPRAAATLTNREVNSNGSGKRSSRPRPPHGRPPAQSGKPGQAAEAHHG